MKKTFIYLSIFFLYSVLFSQVPLVKFYLTDGTTRTYNLSDIDSLGVIDKKNNYVMRIHYDDSLVAYYPTEIIGSIKFEKELLNVYIFSYPKSYVLRSIDSLILYIDQYQPLTIGSQVWMLKNLNVDHYQNGDSIPEVREEGSWINLTTSAWSHYDNNSANGKIYGRLYNWYAVSDSRGFAPLGWHVPTDAEWKTLEIYLGMGQNDADFLEWRGTSEGGKLKSPGTELWQSPNSGATNESGFSALPGGYRFYDGMYKEIGNYGYWWSSKAESSYDSWYRLICNYNPFIGRGFCGTKNGLAVRCVKDN